ncbi:MAG TPA: DMT family transporter [Streptosporangiaceae bacterium]|jgi:drug/metabolite transporter (DMT)-like permease
MYSVYVAATVLAAMLCGFGFALQQHAAQEINTTQFLHPGLITRLVRKRRWQAGFASQIAGSLISAWTLGHLALTVTEPLLTTSLIFALILAVPLTGQALSRSDILGSLLLCAGVGALSATRSVRSAAESFGSYSHWPAAAFIGLIAVILVQLGRRRSNGLRATLTGTASGLVLGIADAFTRRSVQILDGRDPAHLLTTWPGYATILASLIGVWLMQNAFNAGPLHASLPAVTAAEPAAGMVLGVVVFGDVVHVSPLLLAVQAAGVVALVAGVIMVARAPVFRELRLRELPHTALERLQHPAAHQLGAPHPTTTQAQRERRWSASQWRPHHQLQLPASGSQPEHAGLLSEDAPAASLDASRLDGPELPASGLPAPDLPAPSLDAPGLHTPSQDVGTGTGTGLSAAAGQADLDLPHDRLRVAWSTRLSRHVSGTRARK